MDEFTSLDADVIAISVDSRYSHREYARALGLTFTLLSDLKGEVARLYEVWDEAAHRAHRATFIIDREGKVRYQSVRSSGIPRDPAEMLRVLRVIEKK